MPSTFVWYDLMTTDPKAAEAFYGSVVGWTARDSEHPTLRYTLLCASQVPVVGLMAIPPEAAGAHPAWMGYIGVADVDAAAKAVAADGGAIHRPPWDIPDIGRVAVVADPDGAIFLLFAPKAPAGMPALPAGSPGTIGWRELLAGDGEAAFAFYARHFGWTKDRGHDMGPMGVYQLFAAGGEAIGGMMTKPPAVPAPFWTYYFVVEAIDAAIERVTAGGGRIVNGPMEVPGGSWIVQAADPQGAFFALAAPKR